MLGSWLLPENYNLQQLNGNKQILHPDYLTYLLINFICIAVIFRSFVTKGTEKGSTIQKKLFSKTDTYKLNFSRILSIDLKLNHSYSC